MAFVVLLLFAGFRGEAVGIDTPGYYFISNLLRAGIDDPGYIRYEPLFTLMARLTSFDGGPTLILIASFATLCCFCFGIYLSNMKMLIPFSVYLGLSLYFFQFNGLRQALAAAIIFAFSIFGLSRGKAAIALPLGCFIAINFHISALFASLVIFLSLFSFERFPVTTRALTALAYLLSFLVLLSNDNFIIQSTTWLARHSSISSYYARTLNLALSRTSEDAFGIRFITNQLICGMSLLALFKGTRSTWHQQVLLIASFGGITDNLFASIMILNRLALYFQIFYAVSLPISIQVLFSKHSRGYISFLFALYLYAGYFRLVLTNSNGVVPWYPSLLLQ